MKRILVMVGALTASLAWAQQVPGPRQARPEPAVSAAPTSAPRAPPAVGVCNEWIAPGLGEGPITLGFFEADTTTGRRVCPRTEVSLGGRLDATVDSADFRGAIGGGALLSASYAQTPERELFLTLEAFRAGFIQNAVIKQTELGLGQLTVGASQIVAQGAAWATASSARLMLPTSTLSDVPVVGLELGQALTWRFGEHLEAHGFAGVGASAAVFAAPQPLAGALLTAGLQYSPFTRFGVVLDVNGRLGGFGSYLAPALALRFRAAKSIGLELAASRPVLGTDRPNAVLGLRLAYRAD